MAGGNRLVYSQGSTVAGGPIGPLAQPAADGTGQFYEDVPNVNNVVFQSDPNND